MNVAAWLASLGLETYSEAFAAHGVDGEVLPLLCAEDLRDLGVAAVGHRRKMLAALTRLRESEGLWRAGGPVTGLPADASVVAVGERRQLTVMFVDLLGFTELSVRLDPEELREVLRVYQQAVAVEVARFDGIVSRFLGDGVLAYFGFPRAHEDDPERAVCAGLAVIDAAQRVRTADGLPLRVRVGIATGLVVVGDLIGSGPSCEHAAVGATPNLAARLQAMAEPGSVVISDRTRQLIGGLFDCADLGRRPVQGFQEPLQAWRVIGRSRAEGRFEARQVGAPMPLVGRERELARLLALWQSAKEGAGQVVLLAGEPGIGKSRLVRALVDRLQSEAHASIHCRCSPLHASSPLHPVIEQMERAAGFAHDDTADGRLDKLERLMATASTDVSAVAPLIAALLSVPADQRYPALRLAPQIQREQTLAALLGQLEGLARSRPILVVFEDAHWADPTSLELLEMTVERLRTLRVMMIVSTRPDLHTPWMGADHTTLLILDRLDAVEARAVVEQMTETSPLSSETIDGVVAKADGVPLFLEELTKAVLEADLCGQDGGRSWSPTIPASLQDSLVARLDRLAPVREVAQTAACLGREFDHALLAAVSPLPATKLAEALDLLVGAELLFRSGIGSDARYSFKHALVRDVSYATLLNSRRQQLHARIVTTLETRFPERARAQPQILAQHCAEAGLIVEAIGYWHRAGLSAARRSALKEATTHLRLGLELIPSLPDTPERAARELDLLVALGATLLAAKGEAAPEIGQVYQRARELYRRTGNTDLEPAVLWGLWHFHMNRAELPHARAVASEHLRSAERRGSVIGRAIGHRCSLVANLFAGELVSVLDHLDRIRAIAPPAQGCPDEILIDPWITARSLGACALLLRGNANAAQASSRDALSATRPTGRPYMLAVVLHHTNLFNQLQGDRQAVEEGTAELLVLAKEHGFAHWHATATLLQGWAMARRGALVEGLEMMRVGLAAKRATGSQLKIPYYQGLMACLLGRTGCGLEALSLLEDAFKQIAATGERWFEAELHRIRGEVLLSIAPGNLARALTCFAAAAEVARSQQAAWWEARIARSLASAARAA